MSTPSESLPQALELAVGNGAIDRKTERRGDRQWLAALWAQDSSRAVQVAPGRAAIQQAGESAELAWRPTQDLPEGEQYLLGVDSQGIARFAVHTQDIPEHVPSLGLRALAPVLVGEQLSMALHAVGLANWHATHTHCPRCGSPTVSTHAGAERLCLADDTAHFPRTDPAIIVLVTDSRGRALLGHHRDWPEGRFSTLAGFVEPGESAEEAVVREIAEESRIVVTGTHYLASQPWPFPSSLMLGFEAQASDAEPVPDGTELSEVRWFTHDEFTRLVGVGEVVPPSAISIAHALIARWLGGAMPEGPPGLVWR